MDFCRVKYKRSPDEKVTCFIQSGAILDQAYCDGQFPLDPEVDGQVTFNNRYACYKEIQLDGKDKKDVEYCEFINLQNITAKYECIDDLNLLNAYDDAAIFCDMIDDGTGLRKEKVVCTNYEVAGILRENNEVRMKGADYCYFQYPWDDQYEDLYQCLQDEGLEKKYLSSYCLKQHKSEMD